MFCDYHSAFSNYFKFGSFRALVYTILAKLAAVARMHYYVKFRQNPSIHCGDVAILRLCLGHSWTTNKGYFVIFIIVQKLVALNVVVSKI